MKLKSEETLRYEKAARLRPEPGSEWWKNGIPIGARTWPEQLPNDSRSAPDRAQIDPEHCPIDANMLPDWFR